MSQLGLIDPLFQRRSQLTDLLAELARQDNAAGHSALSRVGENIQRGLGDIAARQLQTAEFIARLRAAKEQEQAERNETLLKGLLQVFDAERKLAQEKELAQAEMQLRRDLADQRDQSKQNPVDQAIQAELSGLNWAALQEKLKANPMLAAVVGLPNWAVPAAQDPVVRAAIDEQAIARIADLTAQTGPSRDVALKQHYVPWYEANVSMMTPEQRAEYDPRNFGFRPKERPSPSTGGKPFWHDIFRAPAALGGALGTMSGSPPKAASDSLLRTFLRLFLEAEPRRANAPDQSAQALRSPAPGTPLPVRGYLPLGEEWRRFLLYNNQNDIGADPRLFAGYPTVWK